MAALAQRFVRISIEPGFAARFRSAGEDAGREFARAFKVRVAAALSTFTPRVKVKVDLDFTSFRAPILPPVNLRVGFDLASAVQAGRRAAQVANAAAGSINLNVNGGGLGNIVNNFINTGIQQISQQFGSITNNAASAASSVSSFGSSLSDLGGPIGQALGVAKVVFTIAALPAVAMAATAALYTLGGALGSLPAVTVGLGFSVGALGLGFMGLGEHLKGVPKAGGGAAKSLSALHNAMRAVTRAQRELTKATLDIDRARADEIERIDDLGRALRGAALDEEDAAAAVARARTELAAAKATGDVNAIGEADRAYRRSLLTLDEARDKTGDLAAEKEKSDKDGGEGSDQVQKALERQRDAVEQLAAANEALAEAQKSAGGGGAAQQLMKLAPAAEQVVAKLKQLKPVFEDIRLATQQALFVGVAGELQKLADAWKAPLKSTLTSYASTFNGLFMNLGKSVRNPEFIKNITAGADTVRQNIDKIGKAITGPLVDAFGRLARAAKPFVDMLGDKIAGMVEHFSDWIKSADESGDLTKFFQDAAYYLDLIWQIGGNVLGLFGDIFTIVFDTKNQGGTKPWLEGFNEQLIMLREWLKEPENQKRIKDFVDRIGSLVANAEAFTLWVTEKGLPALDQLIDNFGKTSSAISSAIGWVQSYMNWWQRLRDRLLAPLNFGGMFDGLGTAFRSALNRVIDGWNSIRFTVPSISAWGFSTPSFTVDPPNIPRLAQGGVVRATPGGRAVTVGEGGEDEIVEPESKMQQLLINAVRMVMGEVGGSRGDITVLVQIGDDQLAPATVRVIENNPVAVAKSNRAGSKRLGYAG